MTQISHDEYRRHAVDKLEGHRQAHTLMTVMNMHPD